ncbi:carbohydrate kinase family protein [Pantoea rwandensis]|uniref:Carbohydrate kinase PfkB domain-containing protein n=1 Tax=Pantoea rwandensis TaxID=1076550 RepID=A0A1X1D3V6_9GAMM|nr:carbohydrate kinase family protein [Pantoea rwandensis]ORM71211.1 hypothetical protein HA51_04880 [Pantoea rwandensis]
MNSKKRILVAGHTCVDLLPHMDSTPGFNPGQTFKLGPVTQRPGGVVPNTGSALSRLGVLTDVQASLGNDLFGEFCRTWLAENITGELHLTPSASGTSYTIVVEPPGADRTFWHYEGSNVDFQPDFNVKGMAGLHVGYPSLVPSFQMDNGKALAKAFKDARKKGVTTSLDLAVVLPESSAAAIDWRAWLGTVLPHVDIFTPSWDDVSSALGYSPEPDEALIWSVAEELLSMGPAVVLLSAGGLGFMIATANGERLRGAGKLAAQLPSSWNNARHWTTAEHFDSIITATGAGDHLTAALLDAISRELEIDDSAIHMRSVVGNHLQGRPLIAVKANGFDKIPGAGVAHHV